MSAAILVVFMIRAGFLDPESRSDLIDLGRDGSVAHRLARRANALVLLDDGLSCALSPRCCCWTTTPSEPGSNSIRKMASKVWRVVERVEVEVVGVAGEYGGRGGELGVVRLPDAGELDADHRRQQALEDRRHGRRPVAPEGDGLVGRGAGLVVRRGHVVEHVGGLVSSARPPTAPWSTAVARTTKAVAPSPVHTGMPVASRTASQAPSTASATPSRTPPRSRMAPASPEVIRR